MTWIATRRWVFPGFSLVNSETRTPDPRWENGYAKRQYVDSLILAFANGSWQTQHFAVSFWKADTVRPASYLELTFGGTLEGHQSDQVRLFDHPGLPLPQLGNSTSANIYQAWIGWFEVYADGDLAVSCWNNIFEKGATEIHGHTYIRTLDGFPAAMPRTSGLDFPDEPGCPSQVWASSRTAGRNIHPPSTENPLCQGLRETIDAMRSAIGELQAEINDADPNTKAKLAAAIKRQRDALKKAIDRAVAAGCHLP